MSDFVAALLILTLLAVSVLNWVRDMRLTYKLRRELGYLRKVS